MYKHAPLSCLSVRCVYVCKCLCVCLWRATKSVIMTLKSASRFIRIKNNKFVVQCVRCTTVQIHENDDLIIRCITCYDIAQSDLLFSSSHLRSLLQSTCACVLGVTLIHTIRITDFLWWDFDCVIYVKLCSHRDRFAIIRKSLEGSSQKDCVD